MNNTKKRQPSNLFEEFSTENMQVEISKDFNNSVSIRPQTDGEPKPKRIRILKELENTSASQIFEGFRIIGLVTQATTSGRLVPFVVQHRETHSYLTVPLSHSFLIYDCAKLALVFVGPQHERRIASVTCYKDRTFTASGSVIYIWKRAKLVNKLVGHEAKIFQLLIFGEFLLSLSEDNHLKCWQVRNGELISELVFDSNFKATVLMHPDTYLNKILVGSSSGSMQLWNLKSKKLVYEFKGWNCGITCIKQSPALDVVGIGLENGKIILHDLKLDRTIVTFQQDEGYVTSLSFRTDARAVLVSGSQSGSIAIWDLEKKRIFSVMKEAHSSSISSLEFLVGEPVLVSSGLDNALKMWIFDQLDGSARLLRSRLGHSLTPSKLRFYESTVSVYDILSCSPDRTFRRFHMNQDQQSIEFSQRGEITKRAKKYNIAQEELKLTPIIDFAASNAKEREWDNIITCHENDTSAYSWNYEKKAIGTHRFICKSQIKSVSISSCGNFTLLGTIEGEIEKFNIQSGIHRGTYVDSALITRAHNGSVQGVKCDSSNSFLVSASLDGLIKFWDFKTCNLLHIVDLNSPCNKMEIHFESSLIAVVTDELVIYILDIDIQKIVRKLKGHTNSITDMTFSSDARWLVSASTDGTVRVWDLPTGSLIDWFTFEKSVTSLSFCPSGEYLATAHVGNPGIFLWSNRTHFSRVFLHPPGSIPKKMQMPRVVGEVSDQIEEEEEIEDNNKMNENMNQDEETTKFTPLDTKLITLSNLPASKWQSLPNLDLIKKRNKPIEPPKKPEKAPFFLKTTSDLNPSWITPELPKIEEDSTSRIGFFLGNSEPLSTFGKILKHCSEKGDYSEALEYLKGLSPSAIDIEFRTLSVSNFEQIKQILLMIETEIDRHNNFEILQAYLNLFLKIHGDIISNSEELQDIVNSIRQKQRENWLRLQTLFHSGMCLVQYFSGIQF